MRAITLRSRHTIQRGRLSSSSASTCASSAAYAGLLFACRAPPTRVASFYVPAPPERGPAPAGGVVRARQVAQRVLADRAGVRVAGDDLVDERAAERLELEHELHRLGHVRELVRRARELGAARAEGVVRDAVRGALRHLDQGFNCSVKPTELAYKGV